MYFAIIRNSIYCMLKKKKKLVQKTQKVPELKSALKEEVELITPRIIG